MQIAKARAHTNAYISARTNAPFHPFCPSHVMFSPVQPSEEYGMLMRLFFFGTSVCAEYVRCWFYPGLGSCPGPQNENEQPVCILVCLSLLLS